MEIAIPTNVAKRIAAARCRHCNRPLRRYAEVAAGVKYARSTGYSFYCRLTCGHCRKATATTEAAFALSPWRWAREIADATPSAFPRHQVGAREGVRAEPPRPPRGEGEPSGEERPEYRAVQVTLLHCMPANLDHGDGEPVTVVTVGKRDLSVEPLVLSIDDTRRLATRLLVALATQGDPLARELLDDHFAGGDEGRFVWPAGP